MPSGGLPAGRRAGALLTASCTGVDGSRLTAVTIAMAVQQAPHCGPEVWPWPSWPSWHFSTAISGPALTASAAWNGTATASSTARSRNLGTRER